MCSLRDGQMIIKYCISQFCSYILFFRFIVKYELRIDLRLFPGEKSILKIENPLDQKAEPIVIDALICKSMDF